MNDESSYAVGWGALALINCNIAQLKGKSGGVWFFLSLLLGPIATLILATQDRVVPPNPPVNETL